MYLDGKWVGLGLGDSSDEIQRIKAFMRRKFASYAGHLPDTPDYDAAMAAVVSDMQQRYVDAGKLRPGDFIPGVINLETKYVMGWLKRPPKLLPVVFTVAGHLGDMFTGPAYATARVLEEQGVIRVQPIGYDNVGIPFGRGNETGIRELHRLVHELPWGTPWALALHSRGSIVGSRFYLEHIRPNADVWPYSQFRGALSFGSPYRERDVVAPWIPDPPKPGTQGISNIRMTNTPDTWMEVARRGDLYAENPVSNAGEHKTAVYRAVQGELWGGADSLAEQMWELVTDFGPELWAVFEAIVSGVRFLTNQDPHNVYDLAPCVEHLRRILTTPTQQAA